MWSFGREPALILIGVAGPLVALVVSFIPGMNPDLQAALVGLAVAVAGVVTAFIVGGDKLAPAIMGVAQAVVSWALAAGYDLTAEQQAGFLAVTGIFVAAFIRTQVDAPVSLDAGRHEAPDPL